MGMMNEDAQGYGYGSVGEDENADRNREGMKMEAELKIEKGWEMQRR